VAYDNPPDTTLLAGGKMPHAGRVINLRGLASQELTIQGTGSLLLEWETDDRAAQDLEVRARMLSTDIPNDNGVPTCRFGLEVGHGMDVWQEPAPLAVQLPPLEGYSLPQRGVSFRVNARQFRIAFTPGLSENAEAGFNPITPTKTIVKVSILPGWGAHAPIYPYQDRITNLGPPSLPSHGIPITPREWRWTDSRGLPLPLGVNVIVLLGINGGNALGPLLSIDPALYADWGPIPHLASNILFPPPVPPIFVSYR